MSKQRVYTFSSTVIEELDKQVNDFIKSEKGINIISISHSSCTANRTTGEMSNESINYSVSLLAKYDKP